MTDQIKQIVSRRYGITHEHGSVKLDYVPPKNCNINWHSYYDSIWPLFVKKNSYGNLVMYTAADIWKFYNEINYRELDRTPNIIPEAIHVKYLQEKFPEAFKKLKNWPSKQTIARMTNRQFVLLQHALLNTRRTDTYEVKEKKEWKVHGEKREEEVTVTKTRNIYLEEHIARFEEHVHQYGQLLGSFWDYRDITHSVVDAALIEFDKDCEQRKNYVPIKSNKSIEELYEWANEKYNLGLEIKKD